MSVKTRRLAFDVILYICLTVLFALGYRRFMAWVDQVTLEQWIVFLKASMWPLYLLAGGTLSAAVLSGLSAYRRERDSRKAEAAEK